MKGRTAPTDRNGTWCIVLTQAVVRVSILPAGGRATRKRHLHATTFDRFHIYSYSETEPTRKLSPVSGFQQRNSWYYSNFFLGRLKIICVRRTWCECRRWCVRNSGCHPTQRTQTPDTINHPVRTLFRIKK